MAWDLIGKNFVPPDIQGKVTGRAKYAEDYRAEGMVFARLLTSSVPHAQMSAADIPGQVDERLLDDQRVL